MRLRPRVQELDAIQYDGTAESGREIVHWATSPTVVVVPVENMVTVSWWDHASPIGAGAEDYVQLDPTDWLIRDPSGFRVITDSTLKELYEPVTDDGPASAPVGAGPSPGDAAGAAPSFSSGADPGTPATSLERSADRSR